MTMSSLLPDCAYKHPDSKRVSVMSDDSQLSRSVNSLDEEEVEYFSSKGSVDLICPGICR